MPAGLASPNKITLQAKVGPGAHGQHQKQQPDTTFFSHSHLSFISFRALIPLSDQSSQRIPDPSTDAAPSVGNWQVDIAPCCRLAGSSTRFTAVGPCAQWRPRPGPRSQSGPSFCCSFVHVLSKWSIAQMPWCSFAQAGVQDTRGLVGFLCLVLAGLLMQRLFVAPFSASSQSMLLTQSGWKWPIKSARSAFQETAEQLPTSGALEN